MVELEDEPIPELRGRLVIITQALVRPIVTLSFAGGVIFGWVTGMISAEAFLGLAGMVITFWFQKREESKSSS